MPPKKVHEVKLVKADFFIEKKEERVGCVMCGLDYSVADYDTLFKAKKLAYFDVSCLNFWSKIAEDFLEDKEAIICHGCLRKAVLKIGRTKKMIKIIIKDGTKTYTCNFYPEKDEGGDVFNDLE